MKRYRISEFIIVSIIITCAVLISMSQTILYRLEVPKGFIYLYVHNYVEDYYYYLHIMRQGFDGNWLATSRLTSELFSPRFINPFFLLLGHVARVSSLSLPTIYTLARVSGNIVLLVLCFIIIHFVFPLERSKRILALLLVIFGTSWWGIVNGKVILPKLVLNWTELDALFRWSYIPHHLWSKVYMVGALIALVKFLTDQKRIFWVYLYITCVIAMGFTSPVAIVTFVGILFLSCIFLLIGFGKQTPSLVGKFIRLSLIGFGICVVIAIYHRFIEHEVFPWSSYLEWEKVHYDISIWDYIISLGPLFLLFCIAIQAMIRRNILGVVLVSWGISGFILLFFLSPFLPLSNIRFLEGYQFIPIAIGAVIGIEIISAILSKRLSIPKKRIIWCAYLLLIVYFVIGLYASFAQQVLYIKMNKFNTQVYIPRDLWDLLSFINIYTPRESIVVAPYAISTMIPAFTSARVIAGHPMMTYRYNDKRLIVDRYYETGDTKPIIPLIGMSKVYIVIQKPVEQSQFNMAIRVYENSTYAVFGL